MTEIVGRTHALRALLELRKRILGGELAGGTRLYEVALAEQLAISRTPVREAMSRLAEEGLLERARNGGFIVRSFGFADVIDAIELRGVLEGTAARLAAERGVGEDELAAMEEVVRKLDECFGPGLEDVDFDTYSELNAQFHERLWSMSGSEMVRREVERMTRLPFASPSAFMPDRSTITAFRRSLRGAQEQHWAILSAIRAREGARAEAVAREHARAARRNLEYVMEKDRSLIKQVPGLALVVN